MDPEHPSTPPIVERAPDLTILTKIEGELNEVEQALGRLDDGTYGTCRVCAAVIEDARLETDPTATTCGEHASV